MSRSREITGCTGKKRHASEFEAIRTAEYMQRKHGGDKFVFQHYQCWACGCWHVGSNRKYKPAEIPPEELARLQRELAEYKRKQKRRWRK